MTHYLSLTCFAGLKPLRKELKPCAVPSVFFWAAGKHRGVRQKQRLVAQEFEEEVEQQIKGSWTEEQVRSFNVAYHVYCSHEMNLIQ